MNGVGIFFESNMSRVMPKIPRSNQWCNSGWMSRVDSRSFTNNELSINAAERMNPTDAAKIPSNAKRIFLK